MWQSAAVVLARVESGLRTHISSFPFATVIVLASSLSAHAIDEIQVYNAEIAKVGQWTLQSHWNYAINGLKQPDFPGGLMRNHTLNGTPEFAYGVTEWFEFGFYFPYAVEQNGRFYSDAGKIRFLFVSPEADKREFFYGMNFEFSYATPKFSETTWNTEIRPIFGWRRSGIEFIVNPILDLGYGDMGDIEFVPAARLAKKFSEDFSLGIEYYTALGPIDHWLPLNQQEHNIYAVVDFKVGKLDVDFGVGYGLTGSSDRWMTKLIIGMDLNEGTASASNSAANARASVRRLSAR
jgi:hypothetical protein